MRPEVTINRNSLSRRRVLTLAGGVIAAQTMAGPLWAQGVPSSKMSAQDAFEKTAAGDIILVDIRRPDEWAGTGVAEGAIALDMREDDFVTSLVALRQANPETPIAMICRTGNRTNYVVTTLASQGFPGLVDVSEGMAGGPNGTGWIRSGLPIYDGNAENIAARLEEVMPCTTC